MLKLAARGCVRIPFDVNSNSDFACIDVNLNGILEQNQIQQVSDTVNLFLSYVNENNNDLNLFYMNQIPKLTSDVGNKFDRVSLGDYRIQKNPGNSTVPPPLSLFHGIYYSLYQIYDSAVNIDADVSITLKEYQETKKNLLSMAKNFTVNDSNCSVMFNNGSAVMENKPFSMDQTISFKDSSIEMKSFKSFFLLQ